MVTPLCGVSSVEKPLPVRSRYLVPLMVMLPSGDRPAGRRGDGWGARHVDLDRWAAIAGVAVAG